MREPKKWLRKCGVRGVYGIGIGFAVQRWVRGHQARRWCRVQRRLERKAAVAIQRVWRGVRCRRTVQPELRTKARQRHAAAVTVQKYMRRWLTRRRVRRLLVSHLLGCASSKANS